VRGSLDEGDRGSPFGRLIDPKRRRGPAGGHEYEVKHDVRPGSEQIAFLCAVSVGDEEGEGTDRQPSCAGERRGPCMMLEAVRGELICWLASCEPADVQRRPLAFPEEQQSASGDHTSQQGEIKGADHLSRGLEPRW